MNLPDQDVFGQVESILAEEVTLARRGCIVAACDAARRADALIADARARRLAPDPDRLDRINRLYDTLGLILAQQCDEVATKRALLRQARPAIHAYRNSG